MKPCKTSDIFSLTMRPNYAIFETAAKNLLKNNETEWNLIFWASWPPFSNGSIFAKFQIDLNVLNMKSHVRFLAFQIVISFIFIRWPVPLLGQISNWNLLVLQGKAWVSYLVKYLQYLRNISKNSLDQFEWFKVVVLMIHKVRFHFVNAFVCV